MKTNSMLKLASATHVQRPLRSAWLTAYAGTVSPPCSPPQPGGGTLSTILTSFVFIPPPHVPVWDTLAKRILFSTPSLSRLLDVIYWTGKEEEVLPYGPLLGPFNAQCREDSRGKHVIPDFPREQACADMHPPDWRALGTWKQVSHSEVGLQPCALNAAGPALPPVDLSAGNWEMLNTRRTGRKFRAWLRAAWLTEVAFASYWSIFGCLRRLKKRGLVTMFLQELQAFLYLCHQTDKERMGHRASRVTSRKVSG